MSKILVSSITIKNDLLYSTNLLDEFCTIKIYIPASTQLSPEAIDLLNTNNNSNIVSTNPYKKNRMIVESYAAASMQATIELIIQTIKRNADITLKSCTKNWCSYYIPIETLTNKVKCEFIIAEKYKSKTGTPAAYDKFAAINGSLPDFTEISKAYTEHDDIILNIELE